MRQQQCVPCSYHWSLSKKVFFITAPQTTTITPCTLELWIRATLKHQEGPGAGFLTPVSKFHEKKSPGHLNGFSEIESIFYFEARKNFFLVRKVPHNSPKKYTSLPILITWNSCSAYCYETLGEMRCIASVQNLPIQGFQKA